MSTSVEGFLAEVQMRRSQVENGHFFIGKTNELRMVVSDRKAQDVIGHPFECKALDIVPQGRTRKPVVAKLTTFVLALKARGGNPRVHPGSENGIEKFRRDLRFLESIPISTNTGNNVFHFRAFMHVKKSET